MLIEETAGDTWRHHPPSESEVLTGQGAGTATEAPDGNKRRSGGSRRRRRRRHSFDGAAGSIARRLGLRSSGSGSRSVCSTKAAERRERSKSCSSFSTSGSVVISALVMARPDDDDDDGVGGGGGGGGAAAAAAAAKTHVRSASLSRQEWVKFVGRTQASSVGDDGAGGVTDAAAGDSRGGGGSTAAADLAEGEGASGNVGDETGDEVSKTSAGNAGTSDNKRQWPLPLEPLAGRCWFEDCGKISSFRCRRCRLAFYCGRDHQRGHWARHQGSCEEGRGEPPPPLARLALPPQRQKSVGWADSTTPRPTDGGAGGASQGWNGGGVGGGGGGGGGVASAAFRKKKSRLEAAIASDHSKAAAAMTLNGSGSFDPNQVRNARGGQSWTVPTSSNGNGSGAGSAAVWPAFSSSSSAGGAGEGGTGIRQRGWRAPQVPPSGSPPPPPGPPPPAKIPPPASRPLLDKPVQATPSAGPVPGQEAWAEVDMLTEMGFGKARAVQALQTCGGSVERAAEWLLMGFDGGGGDGGAGGGGDGVAHGPHLPGAGGGGQDGDGGGMGWLSGGTELEAVGKTGGGSGGGNNDDDDDLITTADASDVGQGLDMRDFPSSGGGGGGGGDGGWAAGGGDDGGSFGKSGWGSGSRGESMAAVEEDDDEDFVTCYEDTVGSVQADIVIFFRSADVSAGATALTSSTDQGGGEEAGGGGVGGRKQEQGEDSVLTVVVRPLPSTAPASVDSGSSRGDYYDRHDTGQDVEHALSLPWPEAEDLVRRHDTAQALRAASSTAVTAAAAAAAAVGIAGDELAGPGGSRGAVWRQGGGGGGRIFGDSLRPPLSPSSPLPPTSRSYDGGAGGLPSWGRKKKIGELIVGMMERRLDGGYDIFAPEVDRASCLLSSGAGLSQADIVKRTYERPRGRSLPKWNGSANVTVRRPPPPPLATAAATAASAWGSLGGGLTEQHKQPWSCLVCTFFNEDPAFRSACEMCSTPRPSTVSALGADEHHHHQHQHQHHHREWDGENLGEPGEAPAAAAARLRQGGSGMSSAAISGGGGARLASVAATPGIEPAIPGGCEVYTGGGGSDDDGEVDGILGGLSPGGRASPTALAAGVLTVPYGAARKGAGIDWERGEEWQGVGNATFGDDSPVVGSPQHEAFGFPLGGMQGDDGAGDGGRGSEGNTP